MNETMNEIMNETMNEIMNETMIAEYSDLKS